MNLFIPRCRVKLNPYAPNPWGKDKGWSWVCDWTPPRNIQISWAAKLLPKD